MKRIGVISILGASLLSGCSPSEKSQTVEYYMEHDDIRATKIKECANNPGELAKTPNCQNAMAAEKGRKEHIGRIVGSNRPWEKKRQGGEAAGRVASPILGADPRVTHQSNWAIP